MSWLEVFGVVVIASIGASLAMTALAMAMITMYGYKLQRFRAETVDEQATMIVTLLNSKSVDFKHSSLVKAWDICVKPEVLAAYGAIATETLKSKTFHTTSGPDKN